jgi:hypothetical protein|tara:strand:+ start:134 stop:385 length:252 start_codon:yes stop_codon:yes gene_type:complete
MRGITMWKGTEEELKKLKESRHRTEMMFLENKDRIVKEIHQMYQQDLEADMTILKKEDWLTNFFMELYMAVNIFRLEEENRSE